MIKKIILTCLVLFACAHSALAAEPEQVRNTIDFITNKGDAVENDARSVTRENVADDHGVVLNFTFVVNNKKELFVLVWTIECRRQDGETIAISIPDRDGDGTIDGFATYTAETFICGDRKVRHELPKKELQRLYDRGVESIATQ